MKPEPDGRAPARGDPHDPPEVAEALRNALADATAKASRLVTVLRKSGKQKKALRTVLGSLRQLTPGGEEPR